MFRTGAHQRTCRKYRNYLWHKNKNCFWCGRPTILPTNKNGNGHDNNTATTDHIKSKLECKSIEQYRDKNNLVLSCYKCNHERDQEFKQKYEARIREVLVEFNDLPYTIRKPRRKARKIALNRMFK